MKKKILFSTILSILVFTFSVFASTNTQTRTKEDLKIEDWITVNSTVIKAALETPKVDETEKVYDFAELLGEQEEQELFNQIQDFTTKNNIDMAIVTINENIKGNAMDYADDFYDYNSFGIGLERDGILFLIDMDTREMWISTTGGAMSKYSDQEIDKILDQTYAKISNQNYAGCVEQFIKYADKYYTEVYPPNSGYVGEEEPTTIEMFVGLFITYAPFAMIPATIIVIVGCCMQRTIKKAFKARAYLLQDTVNITLKQDDFLTTHTIKIPRNTDSGRSGGGSFSSHSGSSGISHGGGGRSF